MLWGEANSHNATPLNLAIEQGHTGLVKLIKDSLSIEQWFELLQAKNHINGETPLHTAITRRDSRVIALILSSLAGHDVWQSTLLQQCFVCSSCFSISWSHSSSWHLSVTAIGFIASHGLETVLMMIRDALPIDVWLDALFSHLTYLECHGLMKGKHEAVVGRYEC